MNDREKDRIAPIILRLVMQHVEKLSSMPNTIAIVTAKRAGEDIIYGMTSICIPESDVLATAVMLQQAFQNYVQQHRAEIVKAAMAEMLDHMANNAESSGKETSAFLAKLGIPEIDPNAN